VLLSCLASCTEQPSGPEPATLEVVVAGGDGQYGTAEQELPRPLQVAVREAATLLPVEDVGIRWSVVSGDATLVGSEVRITGEDGIAEIPLRLGSTEGPISVTATLTTRGTASVELVAFLVGRPELDAVEPASVTAGGTVVLTGSNFSPEADQNVVLFSGMRGEVVEASGTRLEVVVPPCLPTREVAVEMRLGVVASGAFPLKIEESGPAELPAWGEVVDVVDENGLACVRLSGASGARYLAVVHTTSMVGAARYPFALTGLVPEWLLAVGPNDAGSAILARRPGGGDAIVAGGVQASGPASPHGNLQQAFDERLRRLEETLAARRGAAGDVGPGATPSPAPHPESASAPASPRAPPAGAPSPGEQRSFFVYNGGASSTGEGFDEVTATARYVGDRVAIFVDDAAPPGGFEQEDLETFAARFEDVVDPTVRGAFGDPSDLDGNDMVVVLFTPVVNRLTEEGSDSFVGGFFYGRDLLPELAHSNGAEIFYALVPDAEGEYSDPRPAELVLESVPAILAHEFQHMVHFNERVLRNSGASGQDALWMLEALAQMAEELVARTYVEDGDPVGAQLFRAGNRRRAQLYLQATDTVSLIVSSGSGSLGERGAGFLFLLYLDAQFGGDLLGRLTRSHRTGVANVEAEVGRAWEELLPDWWAALYLDDATAGADRLAFPGFDLPLFLGGSPTVTVDLAGGTDFRHVETLPSSSAKYFLIDPPGAASVSVGLGGEGGGAHPRGAVLGLRIVRVP